VLHECLTGVPPYEGAPADVMAAHLYTPLPPLPPGQPPEIEALIGRLTAKDPAVRISDARELALLAADLRDTMAPGRFASLARTGALSTASTALAAPAGAATGLVSHPSDYSGPSSANGPDGWASPAGGQPGPGGPGGPTGTVGLTELSDEWAVPPRMSLPASPTDLSEDRRRRRTGAFAVGAVVVAGGALAGLLVTGALREAPAANPSPAGTPTGATATPTGRPAGVAHATSPAVSTSAAAVPGVTSPQSGTGSKAPTPTGRASATANPTPSTSASASPSVSPSGTGSGSPTSSPSGSPSTSPSPSPPAASPTPTACLLGICL
jgi:eukaryotic-like serine/threonine-protein kinase